MTPEEIRTLRRVARVTANNARNVKTMVDSFAFIGWAQRAEYNIVKAMIESGDMAALRTLRGPSAQEIRDEAKRVGLEKYWSRPADSMFVELTATLGSVYYDDEYAQSIQRSN